MILSPGQYSQASVYDLLQAAERGHLAVDRRWLRAILDRGDQAIPDVVRFAMEDHAEEPRQALAQDLLRIITQLRAKDALPYLIEMARHEEDASADLIAAFAAIGAPSVEPLLALYEEIGKTPDSDIAFLLASIGVCDPRITQTLIERLAIDPVDAAHCLAALGDPAAVSALEKLTAETSEKWERTAIEQSIERLKSPEPETHEPSDIWEEYIEAEDPPFEFLDAVEIEQFLESPEPSYRQSAIGELTAEGLAEELIPRILKLAEDDDDPVTRGRAWQALGLVFSKKEIRYKAKARLADPKAAPQERAGALVAFADFQEDASDVHKYMLELYETPESRGKAMQAMALSQDPRFSDYFPKHLEDSEELIRMQAIQGIGFLEITEAAPRLVPLFQDELFRPDAIGAYALAAETDLSRRGARQLIEKIDRLTGGLDEEEALDVKQAINFRFRRHDVTPIFSDDGELIEEKPAASSKVGRNDPCPCGSGKKFKKCCGA